MATTHAQTREDIRAWQRSLLPGALLDEREGDAPARSTRDRVVDVTLMLLAVAVGLALLADTWEEHVSPEHRFADGALGVVACLALGWRRSRPVAVGVLVIGVATFSAAAGGAGIVAVLNTAIRAPRRALIGLAALSFVSALIFPLMYEQDGYVLEAAIGLLFTAVLLGWGLFARARRELIHSLRERADRVERERRLEVDQARDAERRRIAREMHDVLAHRVSLLSLHAGALEFRPDASPAEVAEAAGVIRASARSVMEELREVIGVLRDGAEGDAPEPPQPTLADLPALVEESRSAGMEVRDTIAVPGGAEALPATIGRTVYRIAQEGLTNARKHAPGAPVALRVETMPDGWVRVQVRNAAASPSPREPLPGAGSGLVGLAERVALVGGELDHGPLLDGGFRLRATLPVPAP